MKVSVIVSAFNAEDILPVTLPPLLAQDYPSEDLEIIVVNDGSPDTTSSVIAHESWAERCIVIHHETNRGRSSTRNTGLRAAKGELLIFVDCDIEVSSDFISGHVKRHMDDKVVGLLSHLQPAAPTVTKYHKYLFTGQRGAKLIGGGRSLPYRYFIFTATSIKKAAIDKTGEFKEELSGYGIDLHYAYRLWKFFPNDLFFAPNIKVLQHALKPFPEALADFRDYGTFNLPIILQDYPDLGKDLGADFVSGRASKKLLGRLLFNSIVRSSIRLMTTLLPPPWCNPFIRYRMADALITGYRTSLSNST